MFKIREKDKVTEMNRMKKEPQTEPQRKPSNFSKRRSFMKVASMEATFMNLRK